MTAKSTAIRFLRAPFRVLGLDLVQWKKPLLSAKELEALAAFEPEYQAEDHWLAKSGIKTVLDVGAHRGEFARHIRTMLPDARIISFEPLKEPLTKLTQRFEGQPNFQAIQCALGEQAGQIEINQATK